LRKRVRFHEGARDEYVAAARWYEQARPGLGEEFQADVESYVDLVAERSLPGTLAFVERNHEVRRVLLNRFPYAVYFEVSDEECVVWAVAHGRRRPGYWKTRL
jgi:toxin ParE1/3/4